jgi:archaeosortase C (PEF-CTERM variant)
VEKENKNLILILLIIAMFAGTVVEIGEGSRAIGVFLFLLSTLLMTKIDFRELTDSNSLKKSKAYLITGVFIILADIGYNFRISGELGTLDIMVLFFGFSLIGTQFQHSQINRVSQFGAYISSVFIFFFLIFYELFGFLGIDFLHEFDHYFILLPTVEILGLIGTPIEVIATETIHLQGVEEMTIVIGGPCSGLYSMFLLMGIVFGYSRIEKIAPQKTLMILGFSILVAYISNLFRVVVLYLTAYNYGQETMMLVHTHLGWIIFAVVAAFIMYLVELKK